MRKFLNEENMIVVDPEAAEPFFKQALSWSESSWFEAKRVSGEMVGSALKTVCAFANTGHGLLLLGLADPNKANDQNRLFGIEENPEAVDELIRKLKTQFSPPIEGIEIYRLPCKLRSGNLGALVLLQVPLSAQIHSIVNDGTWTRGEASNRQLSAAEITELSYRRGVRSAEAEPVDLDFGLLDTDAWQLYQQRRGQSAGKIADQLHRIGLAKHVNGALMPLRAAVLLFADEPGSLLASSGTRADIRIFHYRGNSIERGEVPNLKKEPKTISGPLYKQIIDAREYLLNELASGLTMPSGFKTTHRYPERVLKEAITNAVIHRDYRLNRETRVNIFDNRIVVISPGLLPGKITSANIQIAGSFARNTLVARHLREFPEPPNIDAGEGVPMMFSVMRAQHLYPPLYRENRSQAQEVLEVTLRNEERPAVWEQVSEWIDRNGAIANTDLRVIASVDTLKASKMLKQWVEQGILVFKEGRAKRNAAYHKPDEQRIPVPSSLLSMTKNNNSRFDENINKNK